MLSLIDRFISRIRCEKKYCDSGERHSCCASEPLTKWIQRILREIGANIEIRLFTGAMNGNIFVLDQMAAFKECAAMCDMYTQDIVIAHDGYLVIIHCRISTAVLQLTKTTHWLYVRVRVCIWLPFEVNCNSCANAWAVVDSTHVVSRRQTGDEQESTDESEEKYFQEEKKKWKTETAIVILYIFLRTNTHNGKETSGRATLAHYTSLYRSLSWHIFRFLCFDPSELQSSPDDWLTAQNFNPFSVCMRVLLLLLLSSHFVSYSGHTYVSKCLNTLLMVFAKRWIVQSRQ